MVLSIHPCRATSCYRKTPGIIFTASLFLSCPVWASVWLPNAERHSCVVATSPSALTAWSIFPVVAQRPSSAVAAELHRKTTHGRWHMLGRCPTASRRSIGEEGTRKVPIFVQGKPEAIDGRARRRGLGWISAPTRWSSSRRFAGAGGGACNNFRGPGWSKFASTSRAEFDYSTYSREAELEALPRSSSKRDGQDDAGKEVDNSLTRFLDSVATDDTKKLGCWFVFAVVLSRLRSFYGVMLGTFVLSYMGNTVIQLSRHKGNEALQRVGKRFGWKRLPKKLPRTVYASVYILLLLTAITSLSVIIVPRLTVESQVLIAKLSEQDNPYAIIASWIQSNFGEEALTRLEPFLLSVTGDQGRIFAGYPDNYLQLVASKLNARGVWCEERYARFAKLLQFSLSRYFKGGLNMCSAMVAGLTKVLYKAMVSLLLSFMVIWDLPNLRRGIKDLKTSRLAFAYNTISPQVGTFAKLVGQSFEVQFTIAAINTLLTTVGLIALGVSGPLVLSFIVFLCSFVPVVGVFISTLPMCVAGLGDYGMDKVFQILFMVLGVHAVEAYFLNPQIYASKLKLHPVLVIGVLYVAEHLVGVQGLIIAVPCAVFVINNIIMGNQGTQEGSAKGDVNANTAIDSIGKGNTAIDGAREARVSVG
ncbi:unnamed protein product [Ascophyllum nodosum]